MSGYISGIDTDTVAVVAPLVAVVVVGASIAWRQHRASRAAGAAWPHTSGTVLSATVQVNHHGTSRQETPLVLYSYQVNGQFFRGNRVARRGVVDASRSVTRYPAGACVTVYYDPQNPADSALEP